MSAAVQRLGVSWKGLGTPPSQTPFPKVQLVDEAYGPFITTNEQRRQVQYNAQVRESIRQSKLDKHAADYAVKSQLFYGP